MNIRIPWALKALVTSGLLYYVFSRIDLAEIVAAIASARMDLFAAAFLLVLLMNWVSSCRMKRLTERQGMTVSRRRIFEINLITNFYGLFLPGSLAGGAVRWNKLYKTDKNGTGALVAIVFNRFILTAATAATGMVFWVLAGNHGANAAAGLSLAGILAILLIITFQVLIIGVHENFTIAPGALRGAYHAHFLHLIDQLGGAGKPDMQFSLQHGGIGALRSFYNRHRLIQQPVVAHLIGVADELLPVEEEGLIAEDKDFRRGIEIPLRDHMKLACDAQKTL